MSVDNVTIIAELRDLISRPALQASGALAHLEREVEDLTRDFNAGAISQRQYVKGLRAAARQSRIAGSASKRFRREVDRTVESLGRRRNRGLTGVLAKATNLSKRFGRQTKSMVRSLGGTAVRTILTAGKAVGSLAGEIIKTGIGIVRVLPRVARLGLGISVLIPIITAAVGGLIALAGSAAPMVGLLGSIPGLGLAAGAGLGVAAIGVGGLVEGIMLLASGKATMEEINEFWQNMTPEAKAFGVAMAGLGPGITSIRDAIQTSMLPTLGQAIVDIAGVYLPFFEQKLADVGGAVGRVAQYAREQLTGPEFMYDMGLVWDSTTRLVETLGRAGVHVLGGLRGLMTAAIPMTEKVGGAIEGAFRRFDTWANSPVGRNKMQEFFQDAWDTSVTFFGAVKDLAVALWNVAMIGKDLGDSMGGGMAAAAERFRAWTESTEGQERIRQFFRDIRQTLIDLGELFAAIGRGFMSLGASADKQGDSQSFLDGITAAVPGVFVFIGHLITLAGWVGKVIGWVVRLFEWLGKVPGIGGLLQVIAAVALFVGRTRLLWTILGWVARILMFAFGGWVLALIMVIVGGLILLWQKSETFRRLLGGIKEGFVTGFGQIKEGFIDPIIGAIKSLVEWIGRIDWPSPPDWMTATPSETGNWIVDRVQNAPQRWRDRFRKDGGPVAPGATYTVGEAGREFLLSPSGVTMLGETGQETRRFSEPGLVLPNPVTEAILAARGGAPGDDGGSSTQVPALVGAGARTASSEDAPAPLPPVQVGPFYGAHPEEVRQAVRDGIRDSQRRGETKQTGGRRP